MPNLNVSADLCYTSALFPVPDYNEFPFSCFYCDMFATCSVPPKSELFGGRFGGNPQREEADEEARQVHKYVCRIRDHCQAPGDLPTCVKHPSVSWLCSEV